MVLEMVKRGTFKKGERKALSRVGGGHLVNMPKPKGVSRYKKRQYNRAKGFLKGKIDRNPVSHHEKRILNKIQQHGENMSKQRYEDWKKRETRFTTTIGSSGLRKGAGTSKIGPLAMGFKVSFDRKYVTETIKKHSKLIGTMAHVITLRTAMAGGYKEAIMKLDLAYHLGGKNRFKKVEGDVFDVLKGSLGNYEITGGGFGGLEGGNRYIRRIAGSYDATDSDLMEPTGVKGHHEGKKVNLAEMYEEGTGEFPFGSKLFLLFASQGARRSRHASYRAQLKKPQMHPGFPRVRFMDAWFDRVMFELNQAAYDKTLSQSTGDLKTGY